MEKIEKPNKRLFRNVTQEEYNKAFLMLQEMRNKWNTYRDDDLLMYLLIEEMREI